MSSSSESGSEIDRPSKRRRIHSDTGDSDSMNEANGAKRTGIQTTISGFLSGPGISSAVAAEVNAPSDAEKGRQKGQSSTPSALNLDTVIEVYRFGHTKCHYKRNTIVCSSLLGGLLSEFKKACREMYGLQQDARRANIGSFDMDIGICGRAIDGGLPTFTAKTEVEWQNVVARLTSQLHQYLLLSE